MLPVNSALHIRDYLRFVRVLSIGVVICAAFLLAAPYGLWWYSLARANAAIQAGMEWPVPRRSDSLPTATNAAALDQALASLADAQRWRPDHAYAYRLAGQVYLARAAWPEAIAAFDQAQLRAPNEPLIAWETSLAYEQMQLVIERAEATPIIESLASGQLNAPGKLVRSQFCSAAGAESCYFGRTSYTQPDAADPNGSPITRKVLFLHPPASLATSIRIPLQTPALRFVVGLDPAVREESGDGARFEVFVRDRTGEFSAGELTIDAATARRGWVHGWADLSRWSNQTILLRIASIAVPTGGDAADWYGWADPNLTTREAAQYELREPRLQLRMLWQQAGQFAGSFALQRDQAAAANRPAEAAIWQRRLDWLQR